MTETADALAERQEAVAIAEKKRIALTCLGEGWDDAIAAGVDPEILAHAALFAAFSELISIYGEEAVAILASRLPERIGAGEFSLERHVQ